MAYSVNTISKQGNTKSPLYHTWTGMKGRCYNPKNPNYHLYGSRGIVVCEEWKNSFKQFYKDMGDRPLGKTLDRIDTNGPYSKENCRWATHLEQCNNKRTNIPIEYKGKTKNIKEWAKICNINISTLKRRLTYMTMEEAISTPINIKMRNKLCKNKNVLHDTENIIRI